MATLCRDRIKGSIRSTAAAHNLREDTVPILQTKINPQKVYFTKQHRAAPYNDRILLATVAATGTNH